MNILVCDQNFEFVDGTPFCTGNFSSVPYNPNSANAELTWQETKEIQNEILVLFAVVFGFLVIRKLL